jgi:hypothetical protein
VNASDGHKKEYPHYSDDKKTEIVHDCNVAIANGTYKDAEDYRMSHANLVGSSSLSRWIQNVARNDGKYIHNEGGFHDSDAHLLHDRVADAQEAGKPWPTEKVKGFISKQIEKNRQFTTHKKKIPCETTVRNVYNDLVSGKIITRERTARDTTKRRVEEKRCGRNGVAYVVVMAWVFLIYGLRSLYNIFSFDASSIKCDYWAGHKVHGVGGTKHLFKAHHKRWLPMRLKFISINSGYRSYGLALVVRTSIPKDKEYMIELKNEDETHPRLFVAFVSQKANARIYDRFLLPLLRRAWAHGAELDPSKLDDMSAEDIAAAGKKFPSVFLCDGDSSQLAGIREHLSASMSWIPSSIWIKLASCTSGFLQMSDMMPGFNELEAAIRKLILHDYDNDTFAPEQRRTGPNYQNICTAVDSLSDFLETKDILKIKVSLDYFSRAFWSEYTRDACVKGWDSVAVPEIQRKEYSAALMKLQPGVFGNDLDEAETTKAINKLIPLVCDHGEVPDKDMQATKLIPECKLCSDRAARGLPMGDMKTSLNQRRVVVLNHEAQNWGTVKADFLKKIAMDAKAAIRVEKKVQDVYWKGVAVPLRRELAKFKRLVGFKSAQRMQNKNVSLVQANSRLKLANKKLRGKITLLETTNKGLYGDYKSMGAAWKAASASQYESFKRRNGIDPSASDKRRTSPGDARGGKTQQHNRNIYKKRKVARARPNTHFTRSNQ